MVEVDQYKNILTPLVAPLSLLSNQVKKKFKKIKIFNFGVGLKDNSFKFYNNCSYIPKLYTVAYALSIVASGKAKKIYLAGFDGYQKNDRRVKIIDEIFHSFLKANGAIPITAITPSIYNIEKKSIYTL
jgi:4-hydroxy 2-oxovalerate aldolase